MGSRLNRIITEGQIMGENERGSRFELSSTPPRQGCLVSFSEHGIPMHEHEIELQKQMQSLLEGPGLFLFNSITNYFGDRDTPKVGIRTYLEYKPII